MRIKILLSSALVLTALNAENLQTTATMLKNTNNNLKKVVQQSKQPQTLSSTKKTSNQKLTISEATLLAINSTRLKPQICGKATTQLKWNKGLYQIAKEHSIDMAVSGKLSHNGSGTETDLTATRLNLKRGSFFFERVNQKANSKELLSGELVIRSNASALKSPKDLIKYWISKPKDCKVIMDPRFTDVALAKVISNKDNKAYWTLMLMGPRKK